MEAQFDLVWVSGIVGIVLPLLISLVKNSSWPVAAKRALAVVSSVVAGIVAVGLQAGWALDGDFLRLAALSIVDIYTVASVTYLSFWEGTTLESSLAAIGSSE